MKLIMKAKKQAPESKEPKIERDTFLYTEPRNKKLADQYAQCSTCISFTGKTCMLFTKDFPVVPKGTCAEYLEGEPDPSKHGKEMGVIHPAEAGYEVRDVRCENCRFGNPSTLKKTGFATCMLYQSLNTAKPESFDLDTRISPKGCCSAQKGK